MWRSLPPSLTPHHPCVTDPAAPRCDGPPGPPCPQPQQPAACSSPETDQPEKDCGAETARHQPETDQPDKDCGAETARQPEPGRLALESSHQPEEEQCPGTQVTPAWQSGLRLVTHMSVTEYTATNGGKLSSRPWDHH